MNNPPIILAAMRAHGFGPVPPARTNAWQVSAVRVPVFLCKNAPIQNLKNLSE
jgi:hypothetical protein